MIIIIIIIIIIITRIFIEPISSKKNCYQQGPVIMSEIAKKLRRKSKKIK